MKWHPVLVGSLVWLGVVVAVSGVTWSVINSAGQSVLTESGSTAVPVTRHADVTPSASPTRTRSPHDQPSRTQSASATPSPSTTPSASHEPSASPKPTHSPSRSTAPVVHTRTWEGAAGIVVVSCTGSRIALESLTPNDGYSTEAGSRGPEEVEVHFEPHQEDGVEVEVRAHCSGGEPKFSAGTEAGGDD